MQKVGDNFRPIPFDVNKINQYNVDVEWLVVIRRRRMRLTMKREDRERRSEKLIFDLWVEGVLIMSHLSLHEIASSSSIAEILNMCNLNAPFCLSKL